MTNTLHPYSAAVALLSIGIVSSALAQTESNQINTAKPNSSTVEYVHVYGEQGRTNTATNLDLTIFETPQTVTAISRSQMNDFMLNKANDVLDYTPGVTVEEVETHRTYYTARGFDIVNFQYDGVGTPFAFGLVQGQADTAIYEKIEVVKGAAGLITGLANPSATINFVRKRPTEDLRASARASVNEWNGYRLDGDISGSFSDSIRGRLVVATEDTESYLDRLEESTNLFYGVLEFDLSDKTLFTIGHSYDLNAADGILWGALPLIYSDGRATDYDVSTSSAPDWSFLDTEQNQSFLELKHRLSDMWTVNAVYTRSDIDIKADLFYVDGTPMPDESGLGAYTGRYLNGATRDIIDVFASGYVSVAGREHQVVVGYYITTKTPEEYNFITKMIFIKKFLGNRPNIMFDKKYSNFSSDSISKILFLSPLGNLEIGYNYDLDITRWIEFVNFLQKIPYSYPLSGLNYNYFVEYNTGKFKLNIDTYLIYYEQFKDNWLKSWNNNELKFIKLEIKNLEQFKQANPNIKEISYKDLFLDQIETGTVFDNFKNEIAEYTKRNFQLVETIENYFGKILN